MDGVLGGGVFFSYRICWDGFAAEITRDEFRKGVYTWSPGRVTIPQGMNML